MGFFDRFKKDNNNSVTDVQYNFEYLDNLIHKTSKDIVLESDIVLDSSEQMAYEEGIKLEVDNIVIDGNGHIINAKNKTRIFFINAKNIIIKNITIINGYSEIAGGAIWNEEGSNVKIISTNFISNKANQAAGAIINLGEIDLIDCKFESNYTSNIAGAINNQPKGSLKCDNVDFISNSADVDGGAIGNYGQLILKNSKFQSNTCKHEGGSINNQQSGLLKITNSNFIKNEAGLNGGAIICFGEVKIESSKFKHNYANSEGGAINSQYGLKKIINCEFDSNDADKGGGAICAFDEIDIDSCKFISNASLKLGGAINIQPDAKLKGMNINLIKNGAEYGGAIFNFGTANFKNCILDSNKAYSEGGAINNQGILNIDESNFINNDIDNTGASIFNNKEIKIINSLFANHDTNKDIIFNSGILSIFDTKFNDNKSNNAIVNNDNSNLFLSNTKFIKNHNIKSVLFNIGNSCVISNVIFEDNTSDGESCADIYNKATIDLKDPQFINDVRTVYNEGHINLK